MRIPAAPRRSSFLEGCIGLFVVFILIVTIGALIYGWALMIGFGITHAELEWPKHGVGFLPCLGLGVVLGILTGMFRSAGKV